MHSKLQHHRKQVDFRIIIIKKMENTNNWAIPTVRRTMVIRMIYSLPILPIDDSLVHIAYSEASSVDLREKKDFKVLAAPFPVVPPRPTQAPRLGTSGFPMSIN